MDTNIRPLPELLQVFIDNQGLFKTGLCRWTSALCVHKKISFEEECFVDSLVENEQLKKSQFFGYLWELGEIQPRLDWLKEKLKCEHPERRKEYYREGCFKCWECGKVIIEDIKKT